MSRPDRLAEELQQSAAALRAMARDLVGAGDADDLVQDTMLRAWRRPPDEPRGLLPWLGAVLRNLASNRRRDDRRRRQREATAAENAAARGDDRPDPDVLRAVTEALFRLPEPYASTLTRRYFANETPQEIARATGAPLPTVKSRLGRGLQLLRERLDRDGATRRDWRPALACAVALPRALEATAAATTTAAGAELAKLAPGTPTTIAVLLMSHAPKILIGTASLAALAWWAFGLRAPAGPPAIAPATERVEAASASRVDERADAPAPVDREAVVDEQVGAAGLEHAYEFEIRARALDRDGLLVVGAALAVAPRDGTMNRVLSSPAPDALAAKWRARVPTMRVQVGLMVAGSARSLREVEVHAGQPLELALLDQTGSSEQPCAAARVLSTTACTACHQSASDVLPPFTAPLLMKERRHPGAWFADLLLGDTGSRASDFTAADGPELVLGGFDPPPSGSLNEVRGVVYDRNGAPVAGATVALCNEGDLPIARTRTRLDGSYQLQRRTPGQVDVRAGGGPQGIARATVQLVAEEPTRCDLFLEPARQLSGTVTMADGVAPDGWRVEYSATDMVWTDGADVRPDGTFCLANVPSLRGDLLLWSPKGRLPSARLAAVATDGAPLFDLRTSGAPRGALRIAVSAGEKTPAPVFVTQLDTGRSTRMPAVDGALELAGLPAGYYRVVVRGAPFGAVDLGRHYVDGATVVDLGAHEMPAPTLLRLPDLTTGQEIELYLRRPELDVAAQSVVRGQNEFLLPAGDWLLLHGPAEAPVVRPFTTKPGEPTTLRFE